MHPSVARSSARVHRTPLGVRSRILRIWHDVPSTAVLLVLVIVVSGAVLILSEWRSTVAPPEPLGNVIMGAPTQMPAAS